MLRLPFSPGGSVFAPPMGCEGTFNKEHDMTLLKTGVGLAALTLGLAGCASEPEGPENIHSGVSLRPLATDGLAMPLASNAIYMFEDRDFKGDVARLENVTGKPQGAMQEISDDDSVTSLRWNLPPGVVVLFTQHENGTGDRAAVWGQGQVNSVSPWRFNDKISGWAWYDVGGLQSAGNATLPPGATPAASNLPAGTRELYADRDLKATVRGVPRGRSERRGRRQTLGGGAVDR